MIKQARIFKKYLKVFNFNFLYFFLQMIFLVTTRIIIKRV